LSRNYDEYLFETKWTKASGLSIHVYRDPQSIEGVAVAEDARKLPDIRNASIYNMTSRARTAHEGQFVVLKNVNGYYAAVHVLDVKDRDGADTEDELVFQYWILEDRTTDFSKIGHVA
jgi:hypothetical protein